MDFSKLMKKAGAMQKSMEKLQAELAEKTVEFSSGGGVVTAVARGDGTLAEIRIDPKVVNPAEVELLQDLIVAAVDGALKAARQLQEREMLKLASELGLPSAW